MDLNILWLVMSIGGFVITILSIIYWLKLKNDKKLKIIGSNISNKRKVKNNNVSLFEKLSQLKNKVDKYNTRKANEKH